MVKQKQLDENHEEYIVNGNPTKEFFITMLIKDITLRDAIGDLIDNSVDGANRSSKGNDLSNFYVKISANQSEFTIEDNCGGIDLDIAKKYAFRFGRPKEYGLDKYSLGRFGIGMKRAFFKIGQAIAIKSISKTSRFNLDLDVDKWQKKEDDWDFRFTSQAKDEKNPIEKTGTTIKITELNEEARTNFEIESFTNELIYEIRKEHLYSLNKGLKIKINGHTIKPPILTFIYNNEIKPSYWKLKFSNGLSVEAFAGISEDIGDEGGWYIFCNERLITGPDTSEDTGWTGNKSGTGGKADGVATYHDQFHRFRGYIFFNSEDASVLPWNTTKTGIDKDSPQYQYVRKQIIFMTRQVMTLMNSLKKEKEKDTPLEERILNKKVASAQIVPLSKIISIKDKLPNSFVYPIVNVKNEKKTGDARITYTKPYNQVDRVKKYFRISNLKEVGIKTFDYFYDNEIGE